MKQRLSLMFAAASAAFAIGVSSATAGAFDWPQWRGPDRNDVSKETGLLKRWPTGGPKRVWHYDQAGLGFAGFAIADGRLFTMGARGSEELLIALDADTGAELWTTRMGDLLVNNWGDGPRGTPTVDGNRVYAMDGNGDLICADVKSGKTIWTASMRKLGGKRPGWGYCESVLVDGGKVVCTPGGKNGAVVAFDKTNGEVVWQSKEFTEGAQYSSIIPIDFGGERQYVQLTMKALVGLDAKNGKVLWRSDWPGRTAVIPTPIYKEGHVYIASGYSVGCKLVKLSAGGGAEDVYVNKVMKNHHGGVVLVGDYLYGYSDGAGWVCQNFKTGAEVWAEKGELRKGAVHSADGMLYCLDEANGRVALIEATPNGWSERGRFKISPQTSNDRKRGKIWTHPVVANGKLYLRDQEHILCYDVKAR